jgi:hypothetical protein
MNHARHSLVVSSALVLSLAACGDDTGSTGAGGGGTGGGGTTSGATGATTTGGAECGADLLHCDAGLFHCINGGVSFFTCSEYSSADAATYEPICNDGGGTWAEGCCDGVSALGQCVPSRPCTGMGIGFEYADAAGAEESCRSTGGTWVLTP